MFPFIPPPTCVCVSLCVPAHTFVPVPGVWESIQRPVTKEILLEYVDRCSAAQQAQNRKNPADPDSELMPPPPPKKPNRPFP